MSKVTEIETKKEKEWYSKYLYRNKTILLVKYVAEKSMLVKDFGQKCMLVSMYETSMLVFSPTNKYFHQHTENSLLRLDG